ncbi:META domain-containing protein [Haliscomenobacter hydrossis]|uniref:DUF306 domain-containing protein n=1 Tax=Haliscomenobacter hydrossis (strain ATCC 27775 / DSM 1100 / LMG 10767 / O) TaxID=760192 RepID=F4L310_HALH1|nr:META domain-containing protein [Haliscomenobacter hydrossis]AEE50669.1 protein of unknown function DUF306 Meta and HslJ [Haliscomenobacter hydrossis DSM 1100]
MIAQHSIHKVWQVWFFKWKLLLLRMKIDTMRTYSFYICSFLLFVGLISGCVNNNNNSDSNSDNKADLAQTLNGTDWSFYMIEEEGKKISAPAGLKINMAFLEGKLNGTATCNNYSAPYSIVDETIKVGEVWATEKFCDNENWDARFLSAIKTAATCEVKGELLTMVCANGTKLSFSKRTLASITGSEATNAAPLDDLLNLFPNLAPNQMHLYSILVGTNIDVYPFVGETIQPNMYELFDPNSASVFRQATMLGAYAIGKLDDMYILRVPGNKGSNSITLYTRKGDKLVVEMPLALANDEPSVNIQQDAWLRDLDKDGKTEIIVRQISAPAGGVAQDVIRVFGKAADGSYQPSPRLRVQIGEYPLEKLK